MTSLFLSLLIKQAVNFTSLGKAWVSKEPLELDTASGGTFKATCPAKTTENSSNQVDLSLCLDFSHRIWRLCCFMQTFLLRILSHKFKKGEKAKQQAQIISKEIWKSPCHLLRNNLF